MKKNSLRLAHAGRVFGWLWESWTRAQKAVPLLRWISGIAVLAAGATIYLASAQGVTGLDMAVYGMTAALFVMMVPVIFYLLFEVYRQRRADAIFESQRLAHLIQRISRQEIEAHEEARLALENTLVMMQPEQALKQR